MTTNPAWSWSGRIGRGAYTWWGLGLFLLKYNLDRLIAGVGFGQAWFPWDYLAPARSQAARANIDSLWLCLAAVSAPFIYLGLALTIRRLRDVGWPLGLVALFFAPFINFVFFAVLCVLPSGGRARDHEMAGHAAKFARVFSSESHWASALIALVFTVVMGVPLVALATMVLKDYGWGLFMGVPFCMGLVSALLDGMALRRSCGRAMGVAALSVVLAGGLILLLAIEGAICVLMAAPLAFPLALLGGLVGFWIQKERWGRVENSVRVYGVTFAVLPLLLAGEARQEGEPALIEATTCIEISAPPEQVWRHVVSFSELPPPREWIFQTGIAYPQRARLAGTGVGAVRYCEFSTGPFVEPITVWEENRRLEFDVIEQPHPMHEWSPYASIHPTHLEGFFQSQRGRFLLTPVDGGQATRLEGTTWYRHRIWPAVYWRLWSNHLIHAIHTRVLDHIREQTESRGR
jgi:uncharacterized membrane protein YhaH (DUF805 family)